ncbi:MAG: T9SS type A sorting domain-containing protein, partial [Flavobacteriales bacterium]
NNTFRGANGTVTKIIPYTNNRLLLIGSFTSYNGVSRNRIAVIHENGDLDHSFQPGTGFNNVVNDIGVTDEGRIVAVGNFTSYNSSSSSRMVMINEDGSKFTSFQIPIFGGGTPTTILVDSSNGLVIGGSFTSINSNPRIGCARLFISGSLDVSFLAPSISNGVMSISELPSGEFLVSGFFTSINDPSLGTVSVPMIIKLNSNGQYVPNWPSFSINPAFTTIYNSVAEDGIYLFGTSSITIDGTNFGPLAKITGAGVVDGTFTSPTVNSGASVLDVLPYFDGSNKIIITGSFTSINGTSRTYIARLNSSGSNDTSFNHVQFAPTANLQAAAFTSTSAIVAGGTVTTFGANTVNRIVRFATGGQIHTEDYVFGPFAQRRINGDVKGIVQNGLSKSLVIGSFTSYYGVRVNNVASINSNGSFDQTFKSGVGMNGSYVSSALIESSTGSYLFGGDFTSYNDTSSQYLVMTATNGSIIPGFAPSPSVIDSPVLDIVQLPNTNILVAMDRSTNSVVEITLSGSLVRIFATNGKVNKMLYESDGELTFVGDFTSIEGQTRIGIANFNSTLNITSLFSSIAGTASVTDVLQLSNGDYVAAGNLFFTGLSASNVIAKITQSGSIDNSLNFTIDAGKKIIDIETNTDNVIFICGDFTAVNSNANNFFFALNADGSNNLDYNITPSTSGLRLTKMMVDSTDDLIVGGNFSYFKGQYKRGLAKLDGRINVVTSIVGQGNISPSGTTFVYPGDDLLFTITPDAGHCFNSLNINGPITLESNTYLYENITTFTIVYVEFVPQTTYYADLDGDGYGDLNNTILACSQLVGFVPAPIGDINADGQPDFDCDDSEYDNSPAGEEYCGGGDNDCDGLIDEGIATTTWYADLDGDGFGDPNNFIESCSFIPGHVLNSTDCNDSFANANTSSNEICDGIDNDCDGLVDEVCGPPNDHKFAALPIYPTLITSSSTIQGTLIGATVSPESIVSCTSGEDVWYYFQASTQCMTIGVVNATVDILIELQTEAGELVDFEQLNWNMNDDILNTCALVPGDSYYVIVRNQNSAAWLESDFEIYARLLPGSTGDNIASPISPCAYLKADFTHANQYVAHFPFGDVAGTLAANPLSLPNTYIMLNNVDEVSYGQSFSNITIDAVYQISMPGGGIETLIATDGEPFDFTTIVQPSLSLKVADQCPNVKSLGAFFRAEPYLCGNIIDYEWEFTEVLPDPGLPFNLFRGASDRYFRVSWIPGVQPGMQFEVRIRPIFAGNVPGDWSTSASCLQVISLASEFEEFDENYALLNTEQTFGFDEVVDFNIYPNPTNGEFISIISGYKEDQGLSIKITDLLGKEVLTQKLESKNSTIVFDRPLASGSYILTVQGATGILQRKTIIVSH